MVRRGPPTFLLTVTTFLQFSGITLRPTKQDVLSPGLLRWRQGHDEESSVSILRHSHGSWF